MKFKIGDEVKFLDQIGGGKVTKIVNPTMVCVCTEDGFELPVMINEIILSPDYQRKEEIINNVEVDKGDVPVFEETKRISKLQKLTSLQNLQQGIYLSFMPQDQIWLLKDKMDLFIVNYTPFAAVFTLFIKDKHKEYQFVESNTIPSFSKIYITHIEHEEIYNWSSGYVQVLFVKQNCSKMQLPLHSSFAIKESRFVQKESFTANNFLSQKSLIVHLGTPVVIEEKEKQNFLKDDTKATQNKIQNSQIQKDKPFISRYMISDTTAEVDLHIDSITRDAGQLDKSQMLRMQLDLFAKCLDAAIVAGVHKIIFIHGTGVGILKREICKILDDLPNLHYFNASMQKYGNGATEVWLKTKPTQ
ncbi:MAG: DUF2027 domain-containing protein [Bacteroidales bacterium]|jgi:hypothetical protein|nr:DUF2027 domain-containing protein [Bacteroidales bacterium]